MEFTRTGMILFTENYPECVSFYTEVLGLPIMHALDNEYARLTCCDLGGGHYLMIETDGNAVPGRKAIAQNPVWLRFNVNDVEQAARDLQDRGVSVDIRRETWGTLADFVDPDGNICSLRDEATFGQ